MVSRYKYKYSKYTVRLHNEGSLNSEGLRP